MMDLTAVWAGRQEIFFSTLAKGSAISILDLAARTRQKYNYVTVSFLGCDSTIKTSTQSSKLIWKADDDFIKVNLLYMYNTCIWTLQAPSCSRQVWSGHKHQSMAVVIGMYNINNRGEQSMTYSMG